MIDNKQVNLWRGTDFPPTEYHVWVKEDSEGIKLLLFNGTEWIVFLDDATTINKINELIDIVAEFQIEVNSLKNNTINSKKISTNPVLNGDDLLLNKNGLYVSDNLSISQSILNLDILLRTQIIE